MVKVVLQSTSLFRIHVIWIIELYVNAFVWPIFNFLPQKFVAEDGVKFQLLLEDCKVQLEKFGHMGNCASFFRPLSAGEGFKCSKMVTLMTDTTASYILYLNGTEE